MWYCVVVWVVEMSDQVTQWLDEADSATQAAALEAIIVLGREGPNLGRPLVDSVKYSRHKNMKELRIGSKGRQKVRILFAFDPVRRAILLIAGDKAGVWDKWYREHIPMADELFDEHIRELGKR